MSHAVTIQRIETADNLMGEKCAHNCKIITGTLTFTTYATSGVSVDLSADIPKKVHVVMADLKAGYFGQYDYANRKLLIYEAGADGAALDELGAGTKLTSTLSDSRFIALGF